MSKTRKRDIPYCKFRTKDGHCMAIGAFEIGDMYCECDGCDRMGTTKCPKEARGMGCKKGGKKGGK